MRQTDKIKNVPLRMRLLGAGLVLLAAGFLVAGRWDLSLAVGAGALLGWVMLDPRRITWTIFFVAFALPVTIDFGYPTNPAYTVLLLLFALAAQGRLLRMGRDGWAPAFFMPVLILPLCAVLAGVVHWFGLKPIIVGIAPLLCVGLLCWHTIEEARRDPGLIRRIAVALTWFGVAVAVFAKYQSSSGTWPIFDQLAYDWTYTSLFDPTRAAGLSGHPIVYGTFAMAMALVALVLRDRYWYVPFTANLIGLVLSGTRSAWVGMVLALTIWLVFQLRKLSLRGAGVAVAIVVVALVGVVATPPTFTPSSPPAPAEAGSVPPPSTQIAPGAAAGSRLHDEDSANARFTRIGAVWKGITHDASTVIFGNGPEANVRYLEHTGIHDGQAQVFDNTYLSFWYNFGLIGLIGLLLLMLSVLLRLRTLLPAMLMVAISAQVFFFDAWLWPAVPAVFLLAAGLGAADNPTWAPWTRRSLTSALRRRPDADPAHAALPVV